MKILLIILAFPFVLAAQSDEWRLPFDTIANVSDNSNLPFPLQTDGLFHMEKLKEHYRIFGDNEYRVEVYFTDSFYESFEENEFVEKGELGKMMRGKYTKCTNRWALARDTLSGPYSLMVLQYGSYEVAFFDGDKLKIIYEFDLNKNCGNGFNWIYVDGTPLANLKRM